MEIGPLVLNADLFFLILSFLLVTNVIKFFSKTLEVSKDIVSISENVFIIVLITWKISIFLFNPLMIVENPLSIIYFDGGIEGVFLGLFIGLVYYVYKTKNKYKAFYSFEVLFFSYSLVFIVHQIFNYLFIKHDAVNSIIYIFLAIVLTIVFYVEKNKKSQERLFQLVLWFGLGRIFALFFSDSDSPYLFAFSKEQIFYLFLSLVVILITFLKEKGDKR